MSVVKEALAAAPVSWWERPCRVIHGGAVGVDQNAGALLRYQGIPCDVYYPDWSKGRGAGIVRNLKMLDMADAVLAIWDRKSNGTAMVIATAFKRGLPLFVWYRKGDQ